MIHILKVKGQDLIPKDLLKLDCPWCNSEKYELRVAEETSPTRNTVFVECPYCWARGPACETPEGAILNWNRFNKEED